MSNVIVQAGHWVMQILLINKRLIPSQDVSFDFVRNFEKNQNF